MNTNTGLADLVRVMSELKTEKGMREFLLGILTPQELEEIVRRLQIIRLLKKGIPHQQIAKRLNVGVATVTRGSKEIKKGRFKNL
ncbi:hypothetical protein A2841_01110 [Candidatus Kaiserbacteria bacterium RIFCSPHIGHO2_01_FULL_48_10]|uniref:Transcriptional regulator n=1 Tax=Candidatus Kaiserbacteria bacterium RIFCSPHIGHO2_01_FULL_48_10 TaxID=1798476 RepID=A0A1F6C5W0_9BACT|nr:MAG: hypothetical protein A2841_01110 [Candidatus Kaiserbacteria bacterium RIFCSPHIGHO2_01_FULL_48_10]